MIRRKPFPLQTICPNQSPIPKILRLLQPFQPIPHQDPVLPPQLHNIPHRSHRRKLRQIKDFLPGNPFLRVQRLHQPPGHRRPAEHLKGIPAIRLLRIHNHIRRRQNPNPFLILLLKRNLMVIRHHHRHTKLLRQPNLLRSRNPVITGNNRINPLRCRLTDQILIHPIPILHPIRNHRIHLSPNPGKSRKQNMRRIHPINIIIPNNADSRPLIPLPPKQRNRLPHPLHQKRVRKLLHPAKKKLPNLPFTHPGPVPNHPHRQRTNPKLPSHLPIPLHPRRLHPNLSHIQSPFHQKNSYNHFPPITLPTSTPQQPPFSPDLLKRSPSPSKIHPATPQIAHTPLRKSNIYIKHLTVQHPIPYLTPFQTFIRPQNQEGTAAKCVMRLFRYPMSACSRTACLSQSLHQAKPAKTKNVSPPRADRMYENRANRGYGKAK